MDFSGIYAFAVFLVGLAVYALILTLQYQIIKRGLYCNPHAVNFRARYAVLSTFLIQFVVLLGFGLLPKMATTVVAAVVLNILLGFLWLFFVATNADQMWQSSRQKRWLLWPLTAASVLSVIIGFLNI